MTDNTIPTPLTGQVGSEDPPKYEVQPEPPKGDPMYPSDPEHQERIIGQALNILRERCKAGEFLNSPRDIAKFMQLEMSDQEREQFGAVWLDNRHRVIARTPLFWGTVDGAAIYPREVVKAGLKRNAAACIAYHNHPSGCVEPSRADEVITRRLQEALALVDIRLIDHLVVGSEGYVSLAQRGVI